MADLSPVAFDIETSGLDPEDAQITVAGFAHHLGVVVILNTGGRPADHDHLADVLEDHARVRSLALCDDEADLLEALTAAVDRLDADTHYITAFNGETWSGGFDLQFLRTRCAFQHVAWPFDEFAYADTMEAVDRFATGDHSDLEGTYDVLIGDDYSDPFTDSKAAVDAWQDENWAALLLHNLADIRRTHQLAALAEQYVAKSDFGMKTLAPPE
jgi:uncharacterized protein YprB with RNaseH-like and TPR domain